MDNDDDFGTDADFLTALAATEASTSIKSTQPTPQKVNKPSGTNHTASVAKVIQPTPQALPARSSGSSILVSPRQKGNPILTHLRSQPWEYSDILSDYQTGQTTCVLFLSLKYHRLHPEYIYNRIRGLQGKYDLRVLLAMVDVANHEDALKELCKTGLVHRLTLMLCWSAAEAARYLELYKSCEHAGPAAAAAAAGGIRGGGQGASYADRLVEFVTVPRSINRTDALSLVSAFGSVRAAVNARPEEVAVIGGWGEKKVRRWCEVVREPFRARKAARRGLEREGDEARAALEAAVPLGRVPLRDMASLRKGGPVSSALEGAPAAGEAGDEEEAMIAAAIEEEERLAREKRKERERKDNELSDGIAAALAKLRET